MKLASEFGAACAILGLSAPAVAEVCGVRLDTAKSWISGRRTAPPGAWDDLAEMYCALWGGADGDVTPAEAMIQRALRRLKG
jgi:hypothetical protein